MPSKIKEKIILINLAVFTLALLSLTVISDNYLLITLLTIIIYTFTLAFLNNKLGLFLIIILRPCLGLFAGEPTISIGSFEMSMLFLTGGLTLIFALFVILKNIKNKPTLPLLYPWLLFILIILSSFLFSFDKTASTEEFLRIISIFLLFWASFALIKNNKDFVLLVKAIIVSGLVQGLIAIYQFIANISYQAPEEEVANRVFAFFPHPNLLAFYLLVPLTMCFLIFLTGNKKKISVLLFGLISAILIGALMLTFTRGAWIGLFLIIFALGVVKYRRFLIIILLALLMLFFLSNQIRERVVSTTEINPYGSIQYRLDLWSDAISYFQQRPVLGYGTGLANSTIESRRPGKGSPDPHNDYVKIMLENGLIGLASYLFIMIALFRKLFSSYQRENKARLKTTILTILILSIVIYITSLSDNILRNTPLMWSFWSLLGGIFAITYRENSSNQTIIKNK